MVHGPCAHHVLLVSLEHAVLVTVGEQEHSAGITDARTLEIARVLVRCARAPPRPDEIPGASRTTDERARTPFTAIFTAAHAPPPSSPLPSAPGPVVSATHTRVDPLSMRTFRRKNGKLSVARKLTDGSVGESTTTFRL